MFPNLCPGAVGIRPKDVADAVYLAKAHGFQGVDLDIHDPERYGIEKTRALLTETLIRPGGWGIPVDYQSTEERFRETVKDLPRWAVLLPQFGCNAFVSWMLPGSNEYPFSENFERMRKRFREIGTILSDHGCVFGIEFVGPKTSRTSMRHEFIWNLAGMLELCAAVGLDNMGVLLDSWHWYTSGGDLAQIRALRPDQVIYVHVNDAPKGVPVDQQIDNVRAMPMETGVIDLPGFLQALHEIGYAGPVTPEPFNPRLATLPAEESARLTSTSLKKAWEAAGISWH